MEEAAAPPIGVLDGVPLERLLGVLRLAHQLDAARLKGCLAAALERHEVDSLPLLVAAANAAAECELEDAHAAVLARLACALAAAKGRAPPGAARAEVARLNAPSLADLLFVSLGDRPSASATHIATFREYSSLPEYATFRSTRFQAGGVEWRLAMHPCGRGDSDGTHLSLYLECKERAPRPVIASFTLRLRGFPGVLTIQESFKWCAFQLDVQDDGHWCSWGTSTFLELDALHDPYHGYLAGDALRIEVDITMHEVGRGAA
ncbi:MAG: TRAF-like protein [Monoraphidium minutum]|nr:MAG: TRAF-like protein [Monoraphidium minutum]